MLHRILLSVLSVALVLPAAAQSEREITGELTYAQRIALPEAHVAVTLADLDGIRIAEKRFDTDGAQVPLPFSIQGQAATAMTLRSAVFVAGRPAWISEPLEIVPGEGILMLPPITLQPFQPLGFPTVFRCGDREVEVAFIDDMARIGVGGRSIDLMPQPAASGGRFVDPEDEGTWFWSRGSTGTLSLTGETAECVPLIPEPIFPLRAVGQEPGWLLEVQDGEVSYRGQYGDVEVTGALTDAIAIPGGGRYTVDGADLTFDVTRAICRDLATGMPYPLVVAVTLDGETVLGCGGEPARLLIGADWRLASLNGDQSIDSDTAPTLRFLPEGRLAGSGGCNRIAGRYTLTGEALSFGPLASTMMACAEPVMAAERRFVDALAAVDRFDLDDEGALLLIGADTVRLRLTR